MSLRFVLWFLILPAVAQCHPGEALRPHDLWTAWEFDPGVVIPLTLSVVLYAIGSRRQNVRRMRERVCFWAGMATLVFALVSPLHPLGEVLFSAHMVQHELLMLIAAPLLVLAQPLVTFLWALPIQWRKTAGVLSKTAPVAKTWKFLTDPLAAWLIHAIAIWAWHIPYLFDLTLTSELVHTAQHLSFFLTALLFWWALLHTRGRRAYGAGVLYMFTTAAHTGVLGALLTFSPHLWYSAYGGTARSWGLTPIEDQQLGGLIMWVPGALVYIGAALAMFSAWLSESDVLLDRTSKAE